MTQASEFFIDRPNPEWKPGQGSSTDEWKSHKKVGIDPTGDTRSLAKNYRVLTSGITPRPIGFISTIKPNGVANLAPFSCFNVISFDPPLFTISFTNGEYKDTAVSLNDNGECTINIISEWFVEAANFTCINGPLDFNEWDHSGLTPATSTVVKPAHVAESAFSVEAKLVEIKEYPSKTDPSLKTVVAIVEGVYFHAREDILNEDQDYLDIAKLKPVARLGKNFYSTINSAYPINRPTYKDYIE